MLIKKSITVGLDLTDVESVAADDTLLFKMIAGRYQGICFASCYIVSVDRILRQNDPYPNANNAAIWHVSADIEITAIVYTRDEPVTNAVIAKRDNTTLLCTTENAVIIVSATHLTDSFAAGQTITVRINKCQYPPFRNKMVAYAIPHFMSEKLYYTLTDTDGVEVSKLIIDQIKEQSAKFEALRKSATPNQQKIIESITPADPPKGTKLPLDKALEMITSNKPVRGYLTCYAGDIYQVADADTAVIGKSGVLANRMLEEHLGWIRTANEMAQIYDDAQMFKKHENLWRFYKAMKTMSGAEVERP